MEEEKKPEVVAPAPVVEPPKVDNKKGGKAEPPKGAKAPEPIPPPVEEIPVLEEEIPPVPVDYKADSPVDPEGQFVLDVRGYFEYYR